MIGIWNTSSRAKETAEQIELLLKDKAPELTVNMIHNVDQLKDCKGLAVPYNAWSEVITDDEQAAVLEWVHSGGVIIGGAGHNSMLSRFGQIDACNTPEISYASTEEGTQYFMEECDFDKLPSTKWVWSMPTRSAPDDATLLYVHKKCAANADQESSEMVSIFTWKYGSGLVIFHGAEFIPDYRQYPEAWQLTFARLLVRACVPRVLLTIDFQVNKDGETIDITVTNMAGIQLAYFTALSRSSALLMLRKSIEAETGKNVELVESAGMMLSRDRDSDTLGHILECAQ